MTVARTDTFTEAGDTGLASHVADLGGSWRAYVGAMSVKGGGGYLFDGSSGAGNRFNMIQPLNSPHYDVSADFSVIGGANLIVGLMGRNSASNIGDGYEFVYDTLTGQWQLIETVAPLTTVTLTEAWPGNPATMLLRCRHGSIKGFVNGVEKLSLSLNNNPDSGRYAGIVLGNFTGGALDQVRADNFSVNMADTVNRIRRPLPHSMRSM